MIPQLDLQLVMKFLGYAAIGLGLVAIAEQALDLDHIDLMDKDIALALVSMAAIIVLKCSIEI